jgi:hypothetical protein
MGSKRFANQRLRHPDRLIAALESRAQQSSGGAQMWLSRSQAALLMASGRQLTPSVAAMFECDPRWTYRALAQDVQDAFRAADRAA